MQKLLITLVVAKVFSIISIILGSIKKLLFDYHINEQNILLVNVSA